MSYKEWKLPPEFFLKNGVQKEIIENILKSKSLDIVDDYVDFLCTYDGGEGFLGENYLILWSSDELIPFNQDYEVDIYAPGLFLFGSNGGGEGYAFDNRYKKREIVRVPFIGMDLKYAVPIAKNFKEFLFFLGSQI